ncbi:MAG: nitrogen regulatory protein 2 [Clostridia bacterium]|nr:nitrogen regulatory protein 2 [Clostridia bacterium]
MKEIIAIIRMNKVGETKRALVRSGIHAMTAMKVMGRGKMLKDVSVLENLKDQEELQGVLIDSLLKGGRLIPKRMLIICVSDEDVPKVVDTIISVNQSGNSGDGKIFVLPVTDVVRIRTGERGEEAV